MIPFERVVGDSSKDHAVAAFMSITMMNPATALHHYAGHNYKAWAAAQEKVNR